MEYFRDDPERLESTFFEYSSATGTSNLRDHIDKFHQSEYIRLRTEHSWSQTLPSEDKKKSTGVADGPHEKFTQALFHQYLVRFITADDQVGSDRRLTG